MEIEIRNESGVRLDKKRYKEFIAKILKYEKIKKSIGLLFTDNQGIRAYNKKYRNKDKATDVLSFPDEDGEHLGDIVISYEWVQSEYKKNVRGHQTEMLIIHSILHLQGVHHSYDEASLKENYALMQKMYKAVKKKVR